MPILELIACILARVQSGDRWLPALLACLAQSPPVPPTPPPQPPTQPPTGGKDPMKARVQLRHGNSGCTGTMIASRDGARVWILTAAHCVPGVGGRGQATTVDGQQFATQVTATDPQADLAMLVSEGPQQTTHYAAVAPGNAPGGTPIWHAGYGIDVPGNTERGQVLVPADSAGQCQMALSASPGDSGSGIYREDTGEIVSVVCCGNNQYLWGGNVASIARLMLQTLERLACSTCGTKPYIPCKILEPEPELSVS